ncbi:MAG: hypothetical protein U0T73_02335 [Chitinophagales bacterium]
MKKTFLLLGCTMLALWAMGNDSVQVQTADFMPDWRTMFTPANFLLWFLTYIGVLLAQVLAKDKSESDRFIEFFKRLIPGKADNFYAVFSLIFLPIVMSVLVMVFISPVGIKGALTAGLSCSTILSVTKK